MTKTNEFTEAHSTVESEASPDQKMQGAQTMTQRRQHELLPFLAIWADKYQPAAFVATRPVGWNSLPPQLKFGADR